MVKRKDPMSIYLRLVCSATNLSLKKRNYSIEVALVENNHIPSAIVYEHD